MPRPQAEITICVIRSFVTLTFKDRWVWTLTVCAGTAACIAAGQNFIYTEFGDKRSTSFGLVLFTALIGIALARMSANSFFDWICGSFGRFGFGVSLALTGSAVCGLLFVAGWVLDGFPNSGDEYAYVLQAMTYAQGRLSVAAPPLPEAFQLSQFVVKDGIWISQYEPGWAMVLTPAVWLGLPLWVVNPVVGVALLVAVFALARQQVTLQASWMAVIAIGCSAFFILNAASHFSHVATALWGVLFSLFGLRYLQTGDARAAVIASVFVGLVGVTRAFNAVIFLVPFIVALLLSKNRRTGLFWLAIGGAPFLVALLAFNKLVSGDALTMVQIWLGKEHKLLILPNADTIRLMIFRIKDVALFTSPLLPIGYALAFSYLWVRGRLSFTDWIPLLTVIAFVLYPGSGGDQYGPRYYFEAFPLAVLTATKALDGVRFFQNGSIRPALFASALLVFFACQVGYLVARLALEHDVVEEREDLFRKVKSANLSYAVVLVASGTGTIRPMPPPELVRNGLFPSARSVIYAHEIGEKDQVLRTLFPGRQFYRYKNGNLQLAE